MRRLPMPASSERPADVNLTPMLDVVFILLIFFVVVAAFIDEFGIEVDPPTSQGPLTPDQSIAVFIDADSQIRIGERFIDPRVLRALFTRERTGKPYVSVVIDADPRSRHKRLVQVMDASRAAGIYKISMAET